MSVRFAFAFTAFLSALPAVAQDSDGVGNTFTWLSETQDVLAEGVIWNDRFGDGKDRYKTGGMTQSWLLPESIFSDQPWIEGHASAIELQGRGFIATPNNTSNPAPGDRPFAQYVGVGAYLRTVSEADALNFQTTLQTENRVGIEFGYQGEPLPLFEIQEALHDTMGQGAMGMTAANTLDSEVLVNVEAKRTYRFHMELAATDLEFAPFGQVSIGMRENSARAGADLIVGSSLNARTWNHEPAIGALIPGGSKPRDGVHWMTWVGADIGYVASDAFLDGGFDGNSPSVDRNALTGRARVGIMAEYNNFAASYSLNWLSAEFDRQPDGQVIGAFQVKYRF